MFEAWLARRRIFSWLRDTRDLIGGQTAKENSVLLQRVYVKNDNDKDRAR